MDKGYSFIEERSSKHKKKVVLINIVLLVVLVGAVIAFATTFKDYTSDIPLYNFIKESIITEAASFTPAGLFYIGFTGGLFFLPVPQEIFFYLALMHCSSLILSFFLINAGYLLAQSINYFIGRRLSGVAIHLLSKKRVYKARRYVNKRGALAVFLFNALPLPAPLLTFALGITKYNIYRLYFFTALGTTVKFVAIAAFFFIVN